MPEVPQDSGNAERHQKAKRQGGNPEAFLTIKREGEHRHPRRQQDKTQEIKAPGLHGVVRHQHQGGNRADDAHRQVD